MAAFSDGAAVKRLAAACLVLAVAMPGTVLAAAASNTPEGVVREVIGCSRLEDPFARLRCYDSAAGLVQPGYAPPPAPALAAPPMAAAPAASAPTPAPPQPRPQPQARAEAPAAPAAAAPYTALATPQAPARGDQVATIVSATMNQAKHLVLVLDDGVTYLQQDERVVDPVPPPGTQVEVRRGAFRAIFIEIPGQRSLRFQRLRGR